MPRPSRLDRFFRHPRRMRRRRDHSPKRNARFDERHTAPLRDARLLPARSAIPPVVDGQQRNLSLPTSGFRPFPSVNLIRSLSDFSLMQINPTRSEAAKCMARGGEPVRRASSRRSRRASICRSGPRRLPDEGIRRLRGRQRRRLQHTDGAPRGIVSYRSTGEDQAAARYPPLRSAAERGRGTAQRRSACGGGTAPTAGGGSQAADAL